MKKAIRTENYKKYLEKKKECSKLFKNFKLLMDYYRRDGAVETRPTNFVNAFGTIAGYIFDYQMNPSVHTKDLDAVVDRIKLLSSEIELLHPKTNRDEYITHNRGLWFVLKTLNQVEKFLDSEDNLDRSLDFVIMAILNEELRTNPIVEKHFGKEETERIRIQMEKLILSDFVALDQPVTKHPIDAIVEHNDKYADLLMNLELNPTINAAIKSAKLHSKGYIR